MTHVDISKGMSGVPPRPIHERQLDEAMLRLQRAASASHQHGQIIEATRNTFALMFAAVGLVVTATGYGREWVTVLGAAWFLVSSFLLKTMISTTAKEGALLQEQFDTALFHLPWCTAATGDPVSDHEIARLARKLPIGGDRDKRITSGWYDPTDGVHYPYDVLISQEQNLSWDARLRRTYSAWITATAVAWVALGAIVIGIVGGGTLLALLGFFAPSLAALQLAMEIRSGQRRVADERERLAKIVQSELRQAKSGPIPRAERDRLCQVARNIQDGIYRTRVDVARVPEWVYGLKRDSDELDFGETAEGYRTRLTG